VATLLVNVVGSGVMGLCYAMIGFGLAISEHMRGLVMVGFLGALTTFSAFSLDAVKLIEKGDVAAGLAYIFGSVILSLAAFLLVLMVARGFLAGQ
jgi:CrcB protein